MQFIDPFRDFDPLDGGIPPPCSLTIQGIVDVARKFLPKGITRKQIDAIVEKLNLVLYEKQKVSEVEIPGVDNDNISLDIPTPGYRSPIEILERCWSSDKKAESPVFEDPEWPAAFGILALALVGEAIRQRAVLHESELDPNLIAEASQAAQHCRTVANSGPVDELITRHASEQGRKAAIDKNAPFARWKTKFQNWVRRDYLPSCDGGRFTKIEAARQFYRCQIEPAMESGQAPEFEVFYERALRRAEKKGVDVTSDTARRDARIQSEANIHRMLADSL